MYAGTARHPAFDTRTSVRAHTAILFPTIHIIIIVIKKREAAVAARQGTACRDVAPQARTCVATYKGVSEICALRDGGA